MVRPAPLRRLRKHPKGLADGPTADGALGALRLEQRRARLAARHVRARPDDHALAPLQAHHALLAWLRHRLRWLLRPRSRRRGATRLDILVPAPPPRLLRGGRLGPCRCRRTARGKGATQRRPRRRRRACRDPCGLQPLLLQVEVPSHVAREARDNGVDYDKQEHHEDDPVLPVLRVASSERDGREQVQTEDANEAIHQGGMRDEKIDVELGGGVQADRGDEQEDDVEGRAQFADAATKRTQRQRDEAQRHLHEERVERVVSHQQQRV
mmetsp:Transcript_15657/g.54375  ORF Transcript_15657/g.54375 Transcript_15657/m.54375 type:complete len:268 (+) Transcript_15657:195-998(+)